MERTDKLAARKGISLRGLAPVVGLSVASLFGYRNGSIPISGKAWSKLEQSEKAAGICNVDSDPCKGDAEEMQGECASGAGAGEKAGEQPAATDPALLAVLLRIAAALERLAEQGRESKKPRSYE